MKIKGIARSEGRHSEKAHLTSEFVTVVKFGVHVLRRLASSLRYHA